MTIQPLPAKHHVPCSPIVRWTPSFAELPALSVRQPWAWLIVSGLKDVENRPRRTHYRGSLLIHAGLSPSKGQARKDIDGGGVNINNVRETNFQRLVTVSDLLFGKHILLRKGKKNYAIVTAK